MNSHDYEPSYWPILKSICSDFIYIIWSLYYDPYDMEGRKMHWKQSLKYRFRNSQDGWLVNNIPKRVTTKTYWV